MATLELINLHCHRRQDVTGHDEPRLKVGDIDWKGVMDKGDTESLRPMRTEFSGTATVTLDELNGGSSKRIGTASIKESNNPKSVHFKTSGAWYELFFKVS